MSNFRNYWLKNRLRILQQRRARYNTDEKYKNKIKSRAKVFSVIDRFLSPYSKEER